MTHSMVRRLVRGAVVGLVLGAVPAGLALPAEAATSPCTTRTTAKAFTQWGDANAYFTVPDGTFESGAANWTKTSGVSTVSGNEPWKVLSSAHSTSLKLAAGSAATTASMCIASDEDSTRFFYRSPGTSGSQLHVSIYVTSGVNVATNDYDISGSTAGWAVSPRIMLPDIRNSSGQQTVKITFTARTGTWQLDDVMVDPWRTL